MFCCFLFLSLSHRQHTCIHDRLAANTTVITDGEPSKRSLKESTWSQIRIAFDYRYIDGSRDDSKTCRSSGQQVTWDSTYTCNESDILTAEQVAAVKETFANVQNFLQRLLKVIPYTSLLGIKIENHPQYTGFPPRDFQKDADLYLAVLSRPYGDNSNTLASAISWVTTRDTNRPIVGAIFLNPRQVPTTPVSEDSEDNEFFFVCIHEIFHALGFSGSFYEKFHSHESNLPFQNPTCSLTKNGKSFTFLVTPYAHIFAQKHFGVDTFTGDDGTSCLSGIELEDGGGGGTAYSHVEGRTFMSELMVGVTIQLQSGPFIRMTDASLAVLEDTGNYKTNWSYARPLIWGNPESIDGKIINDFATGPPQTSFPSGYMKNVSSNYDDAAGFDFKFFGRASVMNTSRINCRNPTSDATQAYCSARETFYNPKNLNQIGAVWVYDFIPFKMPEVVCPSGKAVIPGQINSGKIDRCGEYTCNGYDNFTIRLYNEIGSDSYNTVTCTKAIAGVPFTSNIYIKGDTRHYPKVSWCPDPERFCRTMKLHDMYFVADPFDLSTKQLDVKLSEWAYYVDPNDKFANTGITPISTSSTDTGSGGYNTQPEPTKTTDLSDSGQKFWQKQSFVIGIAVAFVVVLVIFIIVFLKCVVFTKPSNEHGMEYSDSIVEQRV